MKIRFLTSIASPGWSFQSGQVIEVERPDAFLAKLLRVGAAELVLDDEAHEVAVAPTLPQTSTVGRKRQRAARREKVGVAVGVSGHGAEPHAR